MIPTPPKPNFFIVGAPRCGTTALSEYLRTHPDVFFSQPKEPHYFYTDRPKDQYIFPTDEDYLSICFKGADGHQAIGEGSTWYLYSTEAVPNILRFNPKAKYIVMVRHPVDLFRSLYHHLVFMQEEDAPTPEAAWRLQKTRSRGENLPRHFFYQKTLQYGDICKLGEQLERLYQHISPDRVRVIFFDDLQSDPRMVYQETLTFLGLTDDGRTSFPVVNFSKRSRFPLFDRLVLEVAGLKRHLGIKRSFGLLKPLKRAAAKTSTEPLSQPFADELLTFFADDIKKLQHLTGRDLSHWLLREESAGRD
ncbi:MAG: sulfotransferase [Candidatus Paceibacterota bacterium]